VIKYSQVEGLLKKKKDFSYRNFIGFNNSSFENYFCFFDSGKILAYFKEKPIDCSTLVNYFYTC
jgi:hypothetical protein